MKDWFDLEAEAVRIYDELKHYPATQDLEESDKSEWLISFDDDEEDLTYIDSELKALGYEKVNESEDPDNYIIKYESEDFRAWVYEGIEDEVVSLYITF